MCILSQNSFTGKPLKNSLLLCIHVNSCVASKSVPKNVKGPFGRRRLSKTCSRPLLLSLLAPALPSPLTHLLSIRGAGRKPTGSVEADQDGIRQAAALRHGLGLGPVRFLRKPAWASEGSGKPASSRPGERSSGPCPAPTCPAPTCPAPTCPANPSSASSTNNPKIPAEASYQLGSGSKHQFPLCTHFLPTADQASPSWKERSS